jgi:tRNA threonylcarbamoyladenosine biosynthesis protein TsaE
MEFISKSIGETAEIADNFAKSLKFNDGSAIVVGLYGELGSGKTTFMKYLAKAFGIEETVQSPTFVIEKIYDLTPDPSPCEGEGRRNNVFDKLIHIDAYRIEKEEEMLSLGWQEIIADHQNLICIEWPERIAGIMPEHIKIFFEHVSESERKISINNL